jgi:quinol-cytochrome oxidoreductase complex cytochrome b subunit
MRLAGILITACVVLAAAQAAMAALAVLLMGGFLYGLYRSPQATLGIVFLLLLVGIFNAHPLAFLAVVALMTIASMIRSGG